MSSSFLSPLASTVTTGASHTVVASQPIAAGETVAAYGGRCVDRAELDRLSGQARRRSIQIDDDLFLAGSDQPEDADFIHHSCQPNCGMQGSVLLVALRDIAPGEALTYDFAMSDGSGYDEFACACGTDACRGTVSGDDWMLPELQLRYRGHFSPYLARRIASLVSVGAERRAFAF